MYLRIAPLFISLVCANSCYANDTEILKGLLEPIKKISADFSQRTVTSKGEVTQSSQGKLLVQKPGKFRWEMMSPEHHLIISDGAKIWNYDEMLEQVTIQRLQEATGSPVFFLSGDVADIEQDFVVNKVLASNNCSSSLSCFELLPRQDEQPFQWVRIGFNENEVKEMQVLDHLGQTSHFKFSYVSTDPNIGPDVFKFTPPEGVDVIGP